MNKADVMSGIQSYIELKQKELKQIEAVQESDNDSKSKKSFFQAFAERKQIKENKRKAKELEKMINTLSSITENQLTIKKSVLFRACMICNSTAVGEGSNVQRTVARDYITDEYWFVEGDCRAAKKAFSMFPDQFDPNIHFYRETDMERVAEYYGFREIHAPYFRSLNMRAYAHNHHLNSIDWKEIGDPIFLPVRAITIPISRKCQDFLIGFICEKDGEEHILIEPDDLKSPTSGETGAD